MGMLGAVKDRLQPPSGSWSLRVRLAVVMGVFLLGACTETQFLISTAKRISPGQDEPAANGRYKIGEPYQVKGVWYYPAVNYDYDETGIASWYGSQFHNKRTANGETYNMNALTAAHKTLPLPSYVMVVNLENGRSINVRVNDRGPFARGRIIDLSRRSAQLLGMKKKGTARVRVRVLANESRALAAKIRGESMLASIGSPITSGGIPKPAVSREVLPLPQGAGAAPVQDVSTAPVAQPVKASPKAREITGNVVLGPAGRQAVKKTKIFIQAGAFSVFENANRVRALLSGVGPVKISPTLVNGRDLFRVRVGPIVSVAEADRMLEWVGQAGYPNARIIVD